MRSPGQVLIFIAAFILLTISAPGTLLASDIQIIVNNAVDAPCSTTATPACHRTIQEAIDYADNFITANTGTTFSIQVEAGTYPESITLGTGISSMRGGETTRVILTGGGNGTLITINAGNPIISNLSFRSAQIGVAITNNATATIKNNIFNVGQNGTAVQITQSTAQTSIVNNTFYLNNTAIGSNVDCLVKNNIFSSNTIALTPLTTFSVTNITYNDFFPTNSSDPLNGQANNINAYNNISVDPLFVDSANGDFHLLADSTCINKGLESSAVDLGAYGGSGADTVPFQVAGVTAEQTSATSITVNWNKNLDHKVAGYRVWYGRTSLNYNGTGSPVSVPTGTSDSTFTLNDLTTTVTPPASPELNLPFVLNESLDLSWSVVDGATKYKVYWSDSSFDVSSLPSNSIEVATTSYPLSGLVNGQTYYVAVSAIAQSIYFIAVTAVYSSADRTPGISNESIYSTEAKVGAGEIKESALSNVVSDYPEALVAYPNLRNSRHGCFIATAAYGYYSAPAVQALREFRDRYLLTNSAGSAFVRWYYEHGPVAAAYLEAHPGYKPVVRTALMPAVGLALFMTDTSLFIKAVVALFILIAAFMTACRFFKKRLSGSGGA